MIPPAPVAVVIPVLNEELALPRVLNALPQELLHSIIVADNGSTDGTVKVAREHGALVVQEPQRGYGAACLKACAALPAEIGFVVFMDGDGSDEPEEMLRLLQPLFTQSADMTIGSRILGHAQPGALQPQQRFGNWLATSAICSLTGRRFTDLGPFRALTREALTRLRMQDRHFGWTVEMQIKAPQLGLRCLELPVSYRRRIGVSKISGTLLGSMRAGYWILRTLWRYRRWPKREAQ